MEVESMVTQQFAMSNYPPPIPVVKLLCYMFFGYDMEPNNLVGFNKMLAVYRDLSLFNGNCTMWFDNKYCIAYGAWIFLRQGGCLLCCLFVTMPIIILDVLHCHRGHKFTSCSHNLRINPTLYIFNYIRT